MNRRYVVEGTGRFPIDMLRYDNAWPASELDAGTIERTFTPRYRGTASVVVATDSKNAPNEARWLSFGWKVTE